MVKNQLNRTQFLSVCQWMETRWPDPVVPLAKQEVADDYNKLNTDGPRLTRSNIHSVFQALGKTTATSKRKPSAVSQLEKNQKILAQSLADVLNFLANENHGLGCDESLALRARLFPVLVPILNRGS